jgi:hypothetical protein
MKGNCFVPHATAIGLAFAGAILAVVLSTSVPARADIDVRINIGNAPPAPHFVFRARPRERLYPGERVYVVDDPGVGDNDCFRYGGFYWVFREGYWYRSASWRRPFVVVHPRYVPREFYQLSPTRWKHHPSGPPGLMKKRGSGPPGLINRGDGGPPGPMRKGANDHDQGNRGRR